MIIANILFYILSFVLVASALVVITTKNPIYSVLFLILAFFNSAGLFLMLGAEFIAMLMIIVYVGAVAVLFLFVVMMLDVDFEKLSKGFVKNLPIVLVVVGLLLAEFIFIITNSAHILPKQAMKIEISGKTNIEIIGAVLYTDYIYIFQASGIILLVAMIGAITLTLRTREGVRKQNISKQISRTRKDSVKVLKVKSEEGV